MLTDTDRLLLTTGAEELGVTLDNTAAERFERYADRLREVNQHLNLTRVPPEDTVLLHFLDSLTVVSVVRIKPGCRLLDMGSGAGFPGMPLAIAFPDITVTLADATLKRLSFLKSLISDLKIENVRLIHGRAEDLCRTNLQSGFDLVTARAVAKMERLAGWLIPFVAPGGYAVAYKSENARLEIEASTNQLDVLGARLDRIEEVKLPGSEIIRLLAVISARSKPPYDGQKRTKTQRV